MSALTPAQIRAGARALQAFHDAVHTVHAYGETFAQFTATEQATFDRALAFPDADAMAPECLDPSYVGGWAWQFVRIMEHVGKARQTVVPSGEVPTK